MERFIDWCKGLTMEQMFVLTGIGVLVLGIGLGLLIGWIFDKDNGEDPRNGNRSGTDEKSKTAD